MALAGFGRVRDDYYQFLESAFKEIEATDYTTVMRILDSSLSSLRGQANIPTDAAKDFAATVHTFFTHKRLSNINRIIDTVASGEEAIVLTGGASLNIDVNSQVARQYPGFRHFVAPCCDDTGQSLGALCILISNALGLRPLVEFPYLGEGQEHFSFTSATLGAAVDILLEDGVLLLHNGKSEIGPRALGNRSFITRPDKLDVKERVSEHIKQREFYRPIAPVVLEERTTEYFRGPERSPFMLYRYDVLEPKIDRIIGAVHADKSARVQTITRTTNPFLYDLTSAFGERTGTYVLLNTSLNLKGEPLANTWQDTLDVYKRVEGTKGIVHNGSLVYHV
jgi:carbamoyltransferase